MATVTEENLCLTTKSIKLLINFPSIFSVPNFVNSLNHGDFVYFFFRETAVEYINCGKVSLWALPIFQSMEGFSETFRKNKTYGNCDPWQMGLNNRKS